MNLNSQYNFQFQNLDSKITNIVKSTNFELLKKNVEINDYKNVILEQKALSDSHGKMMLSLNSENTAGHHLDFKNENSVNSVEVDVLSLDDYFSDKNIDINFIKMDVEGAEFNVLKGMKILPNKILIELHEEILEKNQQDPLEIKTILESNGFKIKTFHEYWNAKTSQNKIFHSDYILGEK